MRKQFLKGLSEKTLKNIIENDLFDRIPNFKSHDNEIKKSKRNIFIYLFSHEVTFFVFFIR